MYIYIYIYIYVCIALVLIYIYIYIYIHTVIIIVPEGLVQHHPGRAPRLVLRGPRLPAGAPFM